MRLVDAGSDEHEVTPIPDSQRNDTLTSLAGTMRRRGLGLEEIEPALQAVNARRCQPPLSAGEVHGIAASVARYPVPPQNPKPHPRAKLRLAGDHVPEVVIDTDEHRVVDEMAAALAVDPDIYSRGNLLVRVMPVNGVMSIVSMPSAILREPSRMLAVMKDGVFYKEPELRAARSRYGLSAA